jgi:endonuclease/exonuclease/phosphatase family metal-dependent hydrolase
MPNRLPRTALLVLFVFLAALAVAIIASQEAAAQPRSSEYWFCFWNVENLFDDHTDNRENKADKEFDSWFGRDPQALQLKLDHLSKALVEMNQGRGPDILALAEVESVRAAELLRDALNRRLANPALHYTNILMKNLDAGRHIAPAIITRLPVQRDRTRLHGSRMRVLEGHIQVQGHELIVLATHWTSRLTDAHGEHRDKYGDLVYGTFNGMHKHNPAVDVLVCGDFNDPPDSESVTKHLHATGDARAVVHSGEEPQLLDLLADKDPAAGFGTHFYAGKWFIFDHIVVSPGLLDHKGWSCEVNSIHTVNSLTRPGDRQHRPWRFGNEHDKAARGYSDHFPVIVRLKVY